MTDYTEKIVCQCGKSHVEYECIGEDLFSGTLFNCKKKGSKKSGKYEIYCNDCKSLVDECDPYMTIIN